MSGDLVLTVSQLNGYIQKTLRQDMLLKNVTVRGEISQFKPYASTGHWYFTLKDEDSRMDCVMWRSTNIRCGIRPAEGMKVILNGYIDIWIVSGKIQLIVNMIRPEGQGDLHVKFEALKAKLYAEGLFDQSRKQPLPLLPRKIAVVTSQDGAVYHDIRNVSRNRNPGVSIVLIPVPVQGEGAATLIAEGIRLAASVQDVDVVIVGRGGGSFEDLSPFNEEIVAYSIASCPLPVISAVGHETDFTISDMVADIRASTPSNAAELAVPSRDELIYRIHAVLRQLDMAEKQQIYQARNQLSATVNSMIRLRPENRIQSVREKNQLLQQRLERVMDCITGDQKQALLRLSSEMNRLMNESLIQNERSVEKFRILLDNLSPMQVLRRGYTMVTGSDGVITSAVHASEIPEMEIHFSDGVVSVRTLQRIGAK